MRVDCRGHYLEIGGSGVAELSSPQNFTLGQGQAVLCAFFGRAKCARQLCGNFLVMAESGLQAACPGLLSVDGEPVERRNPLSLCITGLRSEEHTSELQSRENLVCRLLLVKKPTDTGE